jgi:hypothetical protein
MARQPWLGRRHPSGSDLREIVHSPKGSEIVNGAHSPELRVIELPDEHDTPAPPRRAVAGRT